VVSINLLVAIPKEPWNDGNSKRSYFYRKKRLVDFTNTEKMKKKQKNNG
jgi:hypothetical protein